MLPERNQIMLIKPKPSKLKYLIHVILAIDANLFHNRLEKFEYFMVLKLLAIPDKSRLDLNFNVMHQIRN